MAGGEHALTDRNYTFPRTHRLKTKAEFSRVFEPRVRESHGSITIYAVPNGLPHPRLGISMSRAVGNAVRRNRIKRLLRESFRFHQYDLSTGYDLLITVRPHEPQSLADYQRILASLMLKLHAAWQKRAGGANAKAQ